MNNYLTSLTNAMTNQPSFDGQLARLVTLKNTNDMTVSFMDIGATWLSTVLPVNGEPREVQLRSRNMTEHMQQTAYFGAIVGRYANRINKGKFTLASKSYQLGTNDGNNSLHGGFEGFDKRRWAIQEQSANHVVFTLNSADGDQGYPGNLAVRVTYTLTDENAVQIDYFAQCDQTCPVNLTNHAYFNLAGEHSSAKSLDHTLQMKVDYYLPTNDELIPTGELRSVVGTSFDFTESKAIGRDFLAGEDQQRAGGYDHAFVFAKQYTDGIQSVATLSSPQGDVVMNVLTTKPSIQFYSGNFLDETPGATRQYQQYDGLALETQFFPDGPNHLQWGNNRGVLDVGDTYQHQTTYKFEF